MQTDLTKRMSEWREGLLSDAEILIDLIAAKSEVVVAMHKRETIEAEDRIEKLRV